MSIGDLPVMSLLKTRMKWYQARQQVLAENVANSDTPGFVPSDLKPLDASAAQGGARFAGLTVTNAAHISGTSSSARGNFESGTFKGWETTPAGNAVVLEEQMMKVTQNQMDYQTATALYARSLALIKSAIG
ncbi:MAG: flagellar basal body rod protein FlgB [Hyphomicrobiales bacterium]